MIDLGAVRPGSTIRIPFASYDKDDGSSITMTNFAAGDILVYKDGGTTERASTAGFTATTDFGSKTGKHVAVIDLSDNTTAGFYAAGSEYLVAIDSVTVDAVTTGGWIARFRIGYPGAVLDTTIATLSTQTSFTLASGPAEDDALNGCEVVIHDVASAVQVGRAVILDYTGATKTVTLAAATTFTVAAGDNVAVLGLAPLQPATAGRTLTVESDGMAHADLKEWLGTAPLALSSQQVQAVVPNTQKVDVETIKTRAVTAAGAVVVGGFVGQDAAAIAVNASGHVSRVTLTDTVTTLTGHTPQTGDSYAIVSSGTHGNSALNTDLDNLLARLTAARAGYLDNLSAGAVATAAQVSGLAVNTRANLNVPVEIETPDASTQVYKVRLHLFDVEGNMEAPDSTPTVALTNAAGTDRSGRLSAASNPSTGVYTWDYTATAGDAEEQLVWVFTVVEGGLTRTYPATSYVVEETAYRFSSADRSNLTAVKAKTDNLPADPADASDIAASFAAVNTKLDTIDDLLDTEIAQIIALLDTEVLAIKAKTDLIPAAGPASAADVNDQVLDVLTTDTFAEPAAVPAATASIKDKIGWLAALARNKILETATTQTLRNDADSANVGAATLSDDGTTFLRGKWS